MTGTARAPRSTGVVNGGLTTKKMVTGIIKVSNGEVMFFGVAKNHMKKRGENGAGKKIRGSLQKNQRTTKDIQEEGNRKRAFGERDILRKENHEGREAERYIRKKNHKERKVEKCTEKCHR